MKNKEIIVEIDVTGEINIETMNFEGPSCVDEIQRLLKGLAELSKEEKKADFYQSKVSVVTKEVLKK
jgi:hypothetical protein